MELPFKKILILSTADWDNPFWTNKQHVANEFSKLGIKVLYFESVGLRQPTSKSKSDRVRIIKRIFKSLKGITKVQENVWVFSPLVIPVHKSKFIQVINNFLMVFYIRFFSALLGIDLKYILTYNPLSYSFLKKFKSKIIYHSVDDLTEAPGLPKDEILNKEPELVKYSYMTFVTSRTLFSKYSEIRKEMIFYQSNVSDYNHFSKAKNVCEKPEDLKSLKTPIIGFVGAISSYKVDFELLNFIAQNRANYSIVLIGKIGEGQPDTNIELLLKNQNIHLIGPKSYKELPKYLSYFDVAILPCPINEYTKAMFPMKFFEYLAAGKQIVSTDLPSIQEFNFVYHKAKNSEDFLNKIDDIINKSNLISNEIIDDTARKFTYSQRTSEMLQIILKN